MKTYDKYKFSLFGLALVVFSFILSPVESKAQSFVSFDVFYNELAPHGSWVHNPRYGQVWIPNVRRDFHPYVTRGRWVMTDYGNTWVSDYSWGWAPFHYGRWYVDDYYGWAWVPGYDWGPAWVAWRSGGGHYGWAPLSPGLNVNVSINIGHRIPRRHWRYVPQRYISHARIYDYCIPPRRATHFYNRTTIINNTYVYNNQHHYYSGPQVREIERVTNRRVAVRQVRPAQRPGSPALRRGSVTMYQPGGRRGQTTRVQSNSGVANQSSFDNRSSYRRSSRNSTNIGSSAPRARSPRVDNTSSTRANAVQNRGSRDVNHRSSQIYSSKKSSTTARGNQYGASRTQRSSLNSSNSRSNSRQSNNGLNQRSTVNRNRSSARTASGAKRTVSSSRSSNSRSGVSRSSTRGSTRATVSRSNNANSRSAVSRSSQSRTSAARSATSRSSRSRPK